MFDPDLSQHDMPFMGSEFKSARDRDRVLRFEIKAPFEAPLGFGVAFLDRALRGIMPSDLVLLGAPSGVGKTELCVRIALTNMERGKRVHGIFLEAEENEIEMRLRYGLTARFYFTDPMRPNLGRPLNFQDWAMGWFGDKLDLYSGYVDRLMDNHDNFWTFYKGAKFGVKELVENIYAVADETDLIIVDHLHYFDFEDDNENRALKNIAKTVREVCQVVRKPIILVAHLRKRDRRAPEIVPGIDEFHGSSDVVKIATKVITLASGEALAPHRFETYFRIPKNRRDGSVTRYVGRVVFNSKENDYEDKFEVGRLKDMGTTFEPIVQADALPYWVKMA